MKKQASQSQFASQNFPGRNYAQGSDQGQIQGNLDLVKLTDGSYLYISKDGKFDIDRFNRDYDQYRIRRKEEMEKNIALKLAALNKPKPEIPIYQQSIGTILINAKDGSLDTLDDLLQSKFELNTFTKNNRLFYIGIIMIFIAIFIFLYTQVFDEF
jgi:hypothetical protein